MINKFFNISIAKTMITLDDNNNTIKRCMKESKLGWAQVSKSLHILTEGGFAYTYKLKYLTHYNLTEEGKRLRDHYCMIISLIRGKTNVKKNILHC